MEVRPKQSASLSKIAAALSKAQGQMINAEKDAKGNYGKYATLAATWDVIRKPLSDNEIAIYQRILMVEGKPTMATMLIHSSGEFLDDCELELKFDTDGRKNAMQAMGSAVTYARRYSLQSVTGVAPTDDDDGEKSGDAKKEVQKKERQLPADVIMPFGHSKGKKLGELDTPTLEKARDWLKAEMGKDPKPQNFKQIGFIYSQVKAVLIDRNPQLPPPSPNDPPFPEDEPQQHPPEEDFSQVSPSENLTKSKPAEKDAANFIVRIGHDFDGVELRDLTETQLRELYAFTQTQMQAKPPVKGVAHVVELSINIKDFLKSMGVQI